MSPSFMRRLLIPVLAVLLIAAVVSSFVQLQPPGQARVVRYGSRIHMLDKPVGIATRFGAAACLVRLSGGRLYFEKNLSVTTRSGDVVDLSVSFTYAPPPAIPAGWPEGDWCSSADPVIFIGLDGADWELLDDYMARGLMPNPAALAKEAARGPLITEHPPLSPLLWTTMMTGISPLEHGILDFTRFNPVTGNKEPITSDERRAPAIWNMATMAGKRVAVFGLWATYPAEPVRGVDVSDRLFTFLFSEGSPPAGIVFPAAREGWARENLREAEASIDYARMRSYLPWLTEADYAELVKEPDPYSRPGSALRRILVETEVYARLSMSYLRGGSSVPRFLGSSASERTSTQGAASGSGRKNARQENHRQTDTPRNRETEKPRNRSSRSDDRLSAGHRHHRAHLRALLASEAAVDLTG